jgi:nucleoside-diphosphate-sugar epimerase
MTILVTGVSGFVGNKLFSELLIRKRVTLGTIRSRSYAYLTSVLRKHCCLIENIEANMDWSDIVSGVNTIVHCAARTPHTNNSDVSAGYFAVNVEGVKNLAEQAAAFGVKRFIFLSSIKVNGEQTALGSRFTSEDNSFPEGAYGISKWEAEQALHQVSARTGLEVVIIRPPLIYGPNVKGNFLSMLRWVHRGIPLPLGAIHNQRSLLGIDNLIDLIITCIDHPAAANQVFLASDDQDLTTTELLRYLSTTMGKPSRLLPVPASLLRIGGELIGREDIIRRLIGNLQIDISRTKSMLDWTPPLSATDGLRKTVNWFLNK